MVFRVHGKVCAVFGGSRGIGKAVSEALAIRGGNVAVISRCQARSNECVDHLRTLTSREQHLGLKCDVSCLKSVQNSVAEIKDTLGQISVLVNSAGINFDSLLLRSNPEVMKDTVNTNLFGAIYTSQAVLKDMLREREGVIINIGSVVGVKGNTGQCAYAASKSGLVGLTKSLAKEVALRNVRVNMAAPGFIETDMTSDLRKQNSGITSLIPLGRFGKANEVAEAVCFLIQTTYMTGEVLLVDGGLTLSL